KVYGITYGAADGLCGGWADHLHLKAGTRILRLRRAAPRDFLVAGCSLPAALPAGERARIPLRERRPLLRPRPLGLAPAILARASGAATVLAIGGPAARLPAARAVGADDVLDFATCDEAARVRWVRDRTDGRGADVVFEAAGAPDAVVTAMRCARDA